MSIRIYTKTACEKKAQKDVCNFKKLSRRHRISIQPSTKSETSTERSYGTRHWKVLRPSSASTCRIDIDIDIYTMWSGDFAVNATAAKRASKLLGLSMVLVSCHGQYVLQHRWSSTPLHGVTCDCIYVCIYIYRSGGSWMAAQTAARGSARGMLNGTVVSRAVDEISFFFFKR